MRQSTHRSLRKGTARQPGLTRHDELIKSAPTEPEAFLRWGAQREREDGRFELSRGRVTCDMIDASRPHGRVAKNSVLELGRLLEAERFDFGIADFAVRTPVGVRSPDIAVDETNPRRDLSTSTPIFIAEVLSPSPAGKDFIEKREEYTAIASLQTYLICSQDEPRVWVWARQSDGAWPTKPTEIAGRGEVIALGGLSVELAMAAIFRCIPDAPTVE